MAKEKENKRPPLLYIAFIALSSLMGMQMIRALVPYFLNVLRDRMELDTTIAAVVALLIFATAFLAGPVNRFLGSTSTFIISAIVLGFTRLALQFWNYEPLGDMILAATGVFVFLIFLPVALGIARRARGSATLHMGIGMLAGMALDVAINGAFFSYDLSWQSEWLPALVVLLIVVGQWFLISRLVRDEFEAETADAPFSIGITWLFLGPYIFLQLLIFANFGWATTTTGISFTIAFALLLVGQLGGLMLLILPGRMFRLYILIFASIAIWSYWQLPSGAGSSSLVPIGFLVAGQVTLSGLALATMRHLGEGDLGDGLRNITIAHGLGFLILVIFLFGYYAGYDLSLPFSNSLLPLICFLIVILCGLPGIWSMARKNATIPQESQRALVALLLLMLVPIAQLLFWPEPQPVSPTGVPIRVMTFNIHGGADPRGHIGLEAIAQVIERENPDVVSLQEVSRGWVINGSMDSLSWLAQRLDMVPFFGPAADGQWGNAVLTRLPVQSYVNIPLPPDDLLLKRAYMVLNLDQGTAESLTLINTHYHNPSDGGSIREDQTAAILKYWNDTPQTVIMGDFNAEHGMVEIDQYTVAGFGDVLDLTGVIPGHTNPVPNPTRRIDYIFITPDLEASDGVVPQDEVSDHLPIAVTATGN